MRGRNEPMCRIGRGQLFERAERQLQLGAGVRRRLPERGSDHLPKPGEAEDVLPRVHQTVRTARRQRLRNAQPNELPQYARLPLGGHLQRQRAMLVTVERARLRSAPAVLVATGIVITYRVTTGL